VYLYHRIQDRDYPHKRNDIITVLQGHSVISLGRLLRAAAILNTFFCLADYLWFKALGMISVGLATALSNSSPFFVYCFSVCMLSERVTRWKVGGVIVSFTGVLMIVMFQPSDSDSTGEEDGVSVAEHFGSTSALACVMVVVSTAIYGIYEVGMQVVVGGDIADLSTLLIMNGLCGLVSIPMWVVGSFALAYCPIPALYEPLGWPEPGLPMVLLIISGLLFGLNATQLVLALCWTTPLETSVGTMANLPVAGLFDFLIHGFSFPLMCVGGSVLVVLGFVMLEFSKSHSASQSCSVGSPRSSTPMLA
jgi:drug/metabolite transporter (DMT)-like permease